MTKILILFAALFLQTANATVYELAGTHSAYGSYHGQLEVRPRADGTSDVTRVITYDQFQFENFRVQQVWSGQGQVIDGILQAQFVLKRADIFNQVDQKARQPEDFKTPQVVAYSVKLNGGGLAAVNTASGSESETVTSVGAESGALPLWQNERQAVASRGRSFDGLGDVAMATVFKTLLNQLHALPIMQDYKDREEYKNGHQYFIVDKTDFAYLRANPDALRVDNKVVDEISLYESALRAEAYGPTLAQKQVTFEAETLAGLNEVGLLSAPIYDGNGVRVGWNPQYDGALWSGMYAASQAMRWKATQDPQALANFRRVLPGILMLMDVTGDPGKFGRTIEPMQPGQALEDKWQQGVAPYQNYRFIKWGNNDMVHGLYYAMAWAYEILPEGDPLLADVSKHAKRLIDLEISTQKWFSSNAVRASGLRALATGSTVDLLKYLAYHEVLDSSKDWTGLDDGFYYEGVADWSGINLITVSKLTDILIAKNLLRQMPAFKFRLKPILTSFRSHLAETAAVYANARRDSLTLAADAFAVENPPLLGFPSGTEAKNFNQHEAWPQLRAESKWSLREIPLLRTRHDASYDRSMGPDWCVSSWPSLPWKYLGGERRIQNFVQSAYAYPLFEKQGNQVANYFAGNPFKYIGSEQRNAGSLRMDFLHAYWLGRLSGAIQADD